MLATLSAGRSRTLAGHGAGARAALTGGYHLAFWVAAALIVVAIVVALVVLQAQTCGAPGPSGAPAGRRVRGRARPGGRAGVSQARLLRNSSCSRRAAARLALA